MFGACEDVALEIMEDPSFTAINVQDAHPPTQKKQACTQGIPHRYKQIRSEPGNLVCALGLLHLPGSLAPRLLSKQASGQEASTRFGGTGGGLR